MSGGNIAASIALTDACGFRFPKIVPNCSFPKWRSADGETGKIALNEWSLFGTQIASLTVRVWGDDPRIAPRAPPP
ncbi:MAG: hypothetical protein ACJAWY_001209 [Sphingomonas echinoides]|jgi:hypothetical protein